MNKIIALFCFVLLFCNCQKEIKRTSSEFKAEIGPVSPYVWSQIPLTLPANNPVFTPDQETVLAQNGSETYIGMGSFKENEFKFNASTQQWVGLAGNNVFFAKGVQSFNLLFKYNGAWYWGLSEWQPNIDPTLFIRKVPEVEGFQSLAPFPGTIVSAPLTFVIGNKGYLLGGALGNSTSNQFWEYNFLTSQWVNRGVSPLGKRAGAIAFVKDNKVYAGLGFTKIQLNGQSITQYQNDWYLIDPSATTGLATIKSSFPGSKRAYAKGFSINNKFYLGWGEGANTAYFTDFWEYDPNANAWQVKSNCPVSKTGRENIQVFAIGNTGYLTKGGLNQFWRYSNSTIGPSN